MMSQASDELIEAMKHSFEFWHKTYEDSPINYPLVWKKALESNSEIIKRAERVWKNNIQQSTENQMQQFLESWARVIRKSNFEIAKSTIQEWQEFWRDTTNEQFKIYAEVLEMLEAYWKNMQSKSIE